MEALLPLPLIDDFLRNYNVGQALLLAFVLAVLGTLPLKSRRVSALTLVVFGVVFAVTPSMVAPFQYRLLGLGLLVLGPVVYVTARR